MTSLRLAALAALGALTYGAAILLLVSSDHRENTWTAPIAVFAGVSFLVAGLVAATRRPDNPTGALMLAVGFLWSLGALDAANHPILFGLGILLGALAFLPFAALLLSFPTGRLEHRVDRAIVVATAVLVTVLPLAFVLVAAEPFVDGCDRCPENGLLVWDAPELATAFNLLLVLGAIGLSALALTRLIRRYRAASPPLRRLLAPVYAFSLLSLLGLIVSNAVGSMSRAGGVALSAITLVGIALIPVAFLIGLLRTRLARSAAADVVVALRQGVPLRDALARALGDPSLEIVYLLEEPDVWIDAEGRRVSLPGAGAAQLATTIEQDGDRVAALLHDPSLAENPALVEAVGAAAGMALRTERLYVNMRAQYHLVETIADTAPSLLLNVGLDGRILNQNRAAVRASGLGDEELVRGRFFWDVFIDPDEREEVRARFHAAAPDFPPDSYENAFTNGRGERRVIAWEGAPVVDDEGRVTSIVAGGLDVTERKERELELERSREALRAAGQRLEAVIESSPAAILEVDLEGIVLRWNPAAERMFGWQAAEVLGKGIPEVPLVPPSHAAELAAVFARVSAGESFTGLESRRLRRDGTLLDVEIAAAPIRDMTGAIIGHVALFSDISDRKRHEEELRESRRRLVQASDDARRALERDLHDGAQQRLVALSLSLRLAEARLRSDPDDAAAILASARAELAHALDELRELARGIHPAVLTERGLAAAVEGLVARAPLPVQAELPQERLPVAVEAAAYFVIAEALTNVAKYAGATLAQVRVAAANGVVTVEVADDGGGGADPVRGTGLRGLADRVAALDGTLSVESPAGRGTTVRAELPVRAPAPAT